MEEKNWRSIFHGSNRKSNSYNGKFENIKSKNVKYFGKKIALMEVASSLNNIWFI